MPGEMGKGFPQNSQNFAEGFPADVADGFADLADEFVSRGEIFQRGWDSIINYVKRIKKIIKFVINNY